MDMQWKEGKLIGFTLTVDSSSNGNGNVRQRPMRVVYNGRVLVSFDSEAGMMIRWTDMLPTLPFTWNIQ